MGLSFAFLQIGAFFSKIGCHKEYSTSLCEKEMDGSCLFDKDFPLSFLVCCSVLVPACISQRLPVK